MSDPAAPVIEEVPNANLGDAAVVEEGKATVVDDAANQPADGEVEITIEGAEQEQDAEPDDDGAPTWVTNLRRTNRDLVRRQREIEAENARLKAATAPAAVVVGEEPTLEGCGYDGAKFTAEYKAWMQRSSAAEQQRAEAEAKAKAANEEWTKKVSAYQGGKTALRVPDFDQAEAVVVDTLSQLQQSILITGAEKPELVVYALGKNPGKARELAAIKDPVKFAFALSKLEDKLKVAPRKPQTKPEQRLPAGGRVAGEAAIESSPDKILDKLRAEAEKSGDLTKVLEYRRTMKARAA